jgi:endo-1,4-beta-xylanase
MAAAIAAAPGLFAARRKANAPPTVPVDGVDSLRAHGAAIGLPVGCAVVPALMDLAPASQDPYTHTVVEQAGILVAENAMKWSSLRPTPTTYNFAEADRLFQFAAQNGQLMRGHNLCWHEQLPGWFAGYATRDNARQLLVEHIQTVAGRYAGRVHSWDVVNEAIQVSDGRPDGLRKSPWLELIGPEYIELAFSAAAKADPRARLTYNDYDIELDTPEQMAKRSQVLLLLRRLHARGVPVQAIGIQSHLLAFGPRPGAGLVSLVREAAQMGLEAYVTEMDVNTRTLPGGPELQDAAVAAVYRSYLDLLLPEPNLKAVLTWGISDGHSWLNQSREKWAVRPDGARQRPLPFDDDFQPTPAFFAMRTALDTARQSVVPADMTAPPKSGKDPYAPFAVPGSPAPLPAPQR